MTNFLKILFYVLICFSSDKILADSNIYHIENNEIFLDHPDILEAREIAKDKAFKIAFTKLLTKILPINDQDQIYKLEENDPINFIKDFTVRNEDFFDSKYKAIIDVNFSSNKINEFLNDYGFGLSNIVSEDFLVLPIHYYMNTFYLWEKNNKWYINLKNEYNENSFLKLFFPELNILNKFKISSKDALSGNIDSLNSVLDFYKKKSAIIIYFDERYDYELERFIGNIKFKVFSQNVFTELKLTGISLGDRISKKTQISLLARESLIALNDWWKNKTTISQYDENNLNEYFFEIESLNLKESIEIEKLLKSSSFFKKLIPINFEKNKIIFKLSSFGSIEKTKLALRSLNLEIINTKKPKTYKLLKLR